MLFLFFHIFTFFPQFSLSTSSITPNTIKDTSFHTEWQCKTRDRHLYIGTSNGVLLFVNVFTGKIEYSLDTGGDVFNSSDLDAYNFLPTIGNFFFTSTDPSKKSLSINNGEIFVSSVQGQSTFLVDENNGIMGCSKSENTFKNQQNLEKSGSIHVKPTKIEMTDNSLLLNGEKSSLPPGSTKVERTDYSIILNGEHSRIFKYSYFNIKTSKSMQSLYPQDVRLLTTSDGNIKLIVNNSIKSNQKITGTPVFVFSTDGLLHFSPHLSDLQISSFISSLPPLSPGVKDDEPSQTKVELKMKKHDIAKADQIIFVQKNGNTFIVPAPKDDKNGHLPQKMPYSSSKENGKIIQQNFIKRTDSTETKTMKFTFNAEIDLNKAKPQPLFSTRRKERNENVNFATNYNFNYNTSNNKTWIALPAITFFAFTITIVAIYIHIENEKKNQFIIVDSSCFSSASDYNQKSLKSINYSLIKNVESITEINNSRKLFVFPLKIEPQQPDCYNCFYSVTYPSTQPFRFDQKFDVIEFFRRMLTAIDCMHKNGIVHGSITEKAFFKSTTEGNSVAIGLIEENAHYSNSKEEFDDDIKALKSVIQRHIANACSFQQQSEILTTLSNDQFLKDFLSNNNFLNIRVNESEFKSSAKFLLLSHPLFMNDLERLCIFEDAYTFFSASSSSTSDIKEFESGSSEIFGRTWARSIPKSFLVEASRHRRYNMSSLRDLVALIRNKWVHRMPVNQPCDTKSKQSNKNQKQKKSTFIQQPQNPLSDNIDNGRSVNENVAVYEDAGIKMVYGNGSPECYFDYFNRKFPKLFLYVYNFCVMKKLKF